MHEMGIASSVLDIVREHVPEPQAPLVRRVRIRVGELAGVQTDSLKFCFDALVAGTPYASAVLDIEYIPAVRECRGCGVSFASVAMLASCPSCGGSDVPLVGGSELAVAEVELADDADEAEQVGP